MEFDLSKLTLGGGVIGNSKAFQSPNCRGFPSHLLKCEPLDIHRNYKESLKFTIMAQCQACNQFSIWLTNNIPLTTTGSTKLKAIDTTDVAVTLIFPANDSDIPSPNTDMPSDVKEVYIEAGQVLEKSPRASAALSRLAIEQLVSKLEPEGRDLNTKIGKLVSMGMPVQIQQMLDSVRVIGNNAVHPGQIDIKDNKGLASSLLIFINLIVENRISQPKMINDVYNSLPESYKKSIEKRDNK